VPERQIDRSLLAEALVAVLRRSWRKQAMSQACAVCSPVSTGFERDGDIQQLTVARS
jgi:hypothetical protein